MEMYMYRGTITGHSLVKLPNGENEARITLGDVFDKTKSPVRVTAYGALADYIDCLEWTDDEERYITSEYHYDSLFDLRYIVIRNADQLIAKVIVAQDLISGEPFRIFGPSGHIDTSNPDALGLEEASAWAQFHSQHFKMSHAFVTSLYAWSLDYAHHRTGERVRTVSGVVSARSIDEAKDIVWRQYGGDLAYNLRVNELSVNQLAHGVALVI